MKQPTSRYLTLSNAILGIALLVGLINYALAVDDTLPQKDGREHYCAAANLYIFGVFSGDCKNVDSGSEPEPSMKREPGTPALIALTFALVGESRDVRVCASTSPDWCKTLRKQQRVMLLLPFLALILLVYFTCVDVVGNANLASAASLCAAFGTSLIEGSMAFLTEPPAAVLFLLVSWMLYRIAGKRRLFASGMICGLGLGLLALTKAVYLYLVPILGLFALLALGSRQWRATACSALAAVIIAALVSGPWIHRNQERFGSYTIAGRDDKVMSIRAALTTMTWSQYWAGYLAFTPKLGAKLIDLLGIERNNVAVFDRSSPESLERGLGEIVGRGDRHERRQRAIVIMVEHWPMQLALIPLTIYRSVFLPVGSTYWHGGHKSLPLHIIRLLSLALATAIALCMMPAFLLNVVVDLWRLNVERIAFHLPAIYSVGIHAVMTQYIPRFNLPLFGVFAIELCLAASLLLTLFVNRDARSIQPGFDQHRTQP